MYTAMHRLFFLGFVPIYTYVCVRGCVCEGVGVHVSHVGNTSVTRLGDFLHFGQPFKASGNYYFTQIAHIVRQFL